MQQSKPSPLTQQKDAPKVEVLQSRSFFAMTLRCRPKGRTAVHPTTIAGQDARPGDVVVTLLGAAKPDPDAVANPDALDLARRGRPVLAFEAGIHFCLGAPLARCEGV